LFLERDILEKSYEPCSLVPAFGERLTTVQGCLRGCWTRMRLGNHYNNHHANTVRSEPGVFQHKRQHWLLATFFEDHICQIGTITGYSSE